MNAPTKPPNPVVLQLISNANQLLVRVLNANTLKNLIFIILNDSFTILPYDRGTLWRIIDGKPEILGVSGQTTISKSSETVNIWKGLISELKDTSKTRELDAEDFPQHQEDWSKLQKDRPINVLWVPIIDNKEEKVGLWLESWEKREGGAFPTEKVTTLEKYMVPGYAAAWDKLSSSITFHKLKSIFTSRNIGFAILGLLALSLLIRVPLRVVAPCEVVAKNPYLITASLDGIIARVNVQPGEIVKKDELLFEYDVRAPLQELKIAQNEVQVMQSEINRVVASSVSDPESLLQLATMKIKLEKAQLELEYAKVRAEQLVERSPRDGVVSVDNPDEWRGRPVKVGEKIMLISNPDESKVRIWIPEDDNIPLDLKRPIYVFLNPNPEKGYEATLNYISQSTVITEKHIPSFVAEADWKDQKNNNDVKLGLKGSAILYGNNVTMFYYIFRKPIATLRTFLGI
jgi:hypothetical protein